MSTQSIRPQPLRADFLEVPIRTPRGESLTVELWREDRIVADLYDHENDVVFLVLDLATEERAVYPMNPDGSLAPDPVWQPTGKHLVQLQPINAVTGEGLGLPTTWKVEPPTDLTRGRGRDGSVPAWSGVRHDPCSSRRPSNAADS